MEIRNVEEIVENYSHMVLQIAYQNVLNHADAEDITQEVFIKFMKHFKKLKNEEHVKAWLIRVTINLCKDYHKNYWNKNVSELNENMRYFDTKEERNVIEEIAKLKPVYRNVIYLYYYQGYKIKEIAKLLRMNQNTVSSNLTRARNELKGPLEEGGEIV